MGITGQGAVTRQSGGGPGVREPQRTDLINEEALLAELCGVCQVGHLSMARNLLVWAIFND